MVYVYQVLPAIKPQSLQNRLESDLELAHVDLKKNFKGFLQNTVRLSEAFRLADAGPSTPPSSNKHRSRKAKITSPVRTTVVRRTPDRSRAARKRTETWATESSESAYSSLARLKAFENLFAIGATRTTPRRNKFFGSLRNLATRMVRLGQSARTD